MIDVNALLSTLEARLSALKKDSATYSADATIDHIRTLVRQHNDFLSQMADPSFPPVARELAWKTAKEGLRRRIAEALQMHADHLRFLDEFGE